MLLMALALSACTDTEGPPRDAPAAPARKSLPCPAGVQRELVGKRHEIIGHSFGWPEPFRAPPLPQRRNKILWELQRPGRATDTADLLITASLNDAGIVVHRRIEGDLTPGHSRPSIIDVPKAGC